MQNVMDTCIMKIAEFAGTATTKEELLDMIADESSDVLIVEFAETISRFVTILDEYFDENLAFELLNCPFPAIQKSAFLLLR